MGILFSILSHKQRSYEEGEIDSDDEVYKGTQGAHMEYEEHVRKWTTSHSDAPAKQVSGGVFYRYEESRDMQDIFPWTSTGFYGIPVRVNNVGDFLMKAWRMNHQEELEMMMDMYNPFLGHEIKPNQTLIYKGNNPGIVDVYPVSISTTSGFSSPCLVIKRGDPDSLYQVTLGSIPKDILISVRNTWKDDYVNQMRISDSI